MDEMERYTDPLDIAARNESIATNDSIRETRLRAKPHQMPDAHGNYLITECIECGELIGDRRLAVSIKNDLCIFCATEQERRIR